MYTQNKIADRTAPCFTPFVIEKESDRNIYTNQIRQAVEQTSKTRLLSERILPISLATTTGEQAQLMQ